MARQLIKEDGVLTPIRLGGKDIIYNPKIDENIKKTGIETAVNIDEAISQRIQMFKVDDEIENDEIEGDEMEIDESADDCAMEIDDM